MKRAKTNVELVKEMMEFSPYGAMSQMFIIDAITKHAEAAATLTDEEVKQMQDRNNMICMTTWRNVGKDIKARMDKFYGR